MIIYLEAGIHSGIIPTLTLYCGLIYACGHVQVKHADTLLFLNRTLYKSWEQNQKGVKNSTQQINK